MMNQRCIFFSFVGLCVWLLTGPAWGQVIFKTPSLLRRHDNVVSQVYSRQPVGSSTIIDSLGNEPVMKGDMEKGESLTVEAVSPAQQQSTLTVTYMGIPIKKERNAPGGKPSTVNAKQAPPEFLADSSSITVDHESFMISLLEDSLRRLQEQIIPLKRSTQCTAQSAFTLYRTIPSILPVRLRSMNEFRISSSYGLRVHPISGRVKKHEGIDLPQPRFTPVYATASGVIDRIIWEPNGMGLAVYIVHPSGYQTGYGHLEDHSVLVGETVQRGQVIGRVGSTGLSTGPHLHYTILMGNVTVNPGSYCFLLMNTLKSKRFTTGHKTAIDTTIHKR